MKRAGCKVYEFRNSGTFSALLKRHDLISVVDIGFAILDVENRYTSVVGVVLKCYDLYYPFCHDFKK